MQCDARLRDVVLPNPMDNDALTVALAAFMECAMPPASPAARKPPSRHAEPVVFLWVGLDAHSPDEPTCAALGRRLRASVRATDLTCWLGSAGCAVRLAGAGRAEVVRVADRLTRTLGTPVAVVTLHPGESASAALQRLARSAALPPPVNARAAQAPRALADTALSVAAE
jgi:hypothetical protein